MNLINVKDRHSSGWTAKETSIKNRQ